MSTTNTASEYDVEISGFRVFLNEDDKFVITQRIDGEEALIVLDRRSAALLSDLIEEFLTKDIIERADALISKMEGK